MVAASAGSGVLPPAYVGILERDPFRPVLPEESVDAGLSPVPEAAAGDGGGPPFRLAGIVSVGSIRAASLEPDDGGEPFFLPEGAERFGWRALAVEVASESVEIGGPSGRVFRLTLADGLRSADPEAALRRALTEVPEPELPPTRGQVEASAASDVRELDERVLESLADEAADVIEAARPGVPGPP